MDADFQRKCSLFVDQHVLCCVSMLVSDLAQNYDAARALDIDEDEMRDICVQDDWKEPVEDFLRQDWDRAQLAEALEDAGFQVYDSEDKETLLAAYLEHLDTEDELQNFAESNGVEPHTIEAYEHWIVDDLLAYQLEQRGEMIARKFMGTMTVWGRPTTGQSISMDGVICDIVESWNHPIIDPNDVTWSLKQLRTKAKETDHLASSDVLAVIEKIIGPEQHD
jgi:hypothetical protein